MDTGLQRVARPCGPLAGSTVLGSLVGLSKQLQKLCSNGSGPDLGQESGSRLLCQIRVQKASPVPGLSPFSKL